MGTQLRMRRGKRKHRLVKSKGPLQGVTSAWQDRVRGEYTWCIVPRWALGSGCTSPSRLVTSCAKESLPPQLGPYPDLPRPTGLTPSAHTPSTLSSALSLPRTQGQTLTPALNSDSTLILLLGPLFMPPDSFRCLGLPAHPPLDPDT